MKPDEHRCSARLANKSTRSAGLNLVKLKTHSKPAPPKAVSLKMFLTQV